MGIPIESQLESLTEWSLLGLPEQDIERLDLGLANLIFSKGISRPDSLPVDRYLGQLQTIERVFRAFLAEAEPNFYQSPEHWNHDIDFFRAGGLAVWIGDALGMRYDNSPATSEGTKYVRPDELFLNGLLDTKLGNCATMTTLHVVLSRRMGWPVMLAVSNAHFLSRFDDGHKHFNIEVTCSHSGQFNSEPDQYYISHDRLPARASKQGCDLKPLSVRETIALFLGLRGRYHRDVRNWQRGEADFLLSRVLLPNHRWNYIASIIPFIKRGEQLFDELEVGHPRSIFEEMAPLFMSRCNGSFDPFASPQSHSHGAFSHDEITHH